ncbi:MAG TPA: serine hydrolase domain-containing protein [Marmoricola sp.]
MAVSWTSCPRSRGLGVVAVALGVVASLVAIGPASSAAGEDAVSSMIATYSERIPELMADQDVPGLAIAVVDRDRVLWVEGFGDRDDDGDPVTTDTIFAVESMSKLFTATAVMQAVAAGRLDLDEPIPTYLPDFTVHSAFEAHPERSITLRTLLSHTAGLTHEAPVGNSNELDPGTFEEHVRSISDTWLRFPVGTGFAYSNLGIDLAGYVLERVEDRPFADVVQDSLLSPLGMDRSTFDRAVIEADDNRAAPHVDYYPDPPLYEAATAAGGLYSSADDLARFLRFQLADGRFGGRRVLDADAMREMRTIPPPFAGEQAGYALGVSRTRWNLWDQRPVLFNHAGGGTGFMSDLWWAPQLGLGVALLTNSDDHELQTTLALSILADLVSAPGDYHDRLAALPVRAPVTEPAWLRLPADMGSLVEAAAMPRTADRAERWAGYAGSYRAPDWDVLDPVHPPERFVIDHGTPYFETEEVDETDSPVRHRLVEVAQGVFLADNGETLDLGGTVPRWRGFRLVRVAGGPAPWQWAVLGGASLVAAAWLVAAASRGARRHSRRRPDELRPGPRWWRRLAATVAALTAVLVLGNAALFIWAPGLVDSGFLGWLEFPVPLRLALHLPLAMAVLGGGTVVLTAAGWMRHWWTRLVRAEYVALSTASAVVAAQLAVWGLVGWGLT